MKTPNTKLIVQDARLTDDEDEELRALTAVDLEDDAPAFQAVDEFSDEFLMQAPRTPE